MIDAMTKLDETVTIGGDLTVGQIALAWQLHRTQRALPIPGTTAPSTSRTTSPLLTSH
jgi:aryl-alcohol dehydrogenase-like predicted oxidoreductase